MTSLIPHIIRKLNERADRFSDLPEVTVPSAAVTDAETAAWSDESYARDLHEDRKARGLLVLVGIGALIVAAILGTASAKADISSVEAAYIEAKGQTICVLLDQSPTAAGVLAIGAALISEGFAGQAAADIVNYSVAIYCPKYGDLLQQVGDAARGRSAVRA